MGDVDNDCKQTSHGGEYAGGQQTVDSGWDSILGRVERGCPPDKGMLGQRPE